MLGNLKGCGGCRFSMLLLTQWYRNHCDLLSWAESYLRCWDSSLGHSQSKPL